MAFDKFVCEKKGYKYEPDENGVMDFRDKTTFPYPSFGEMKPKSMDGYIKKYNFEYAGMSDDEVHIYRDDEGEYVSIYRLFNLYIVVFYLYTTIYSMLFLLYINMYVFQYLSHTKTTF